MDRYLITGFSGFVGKHFLEYLEGLQQQVSVLGVDIVQPGFEWDRLSHVQLDFEKMDLLVMNVNYYYRSTTIIFPVFNYRISIRTVA
jgi:nucleoside-diphosphate-sugar epimerase